MVLMTVPQSVLCVIISVQINNDPILIGTAPRGNCLTGKCCTLNVTRDIRFSLYNQKFRTGTGIELPAANTTALIDIFQQFEVNTALPTIFYLHGFTETAYGQSGSQIKDAYLDTGDYNVILVDWSTLIALPWYITAVRNSKLVGANLADFILHLNDAGIPLANLHLIGFSLGAEAVGFAGKVLKDQMGNPLITRITGLDPAYPLYMFTDRRGHITKTDAQFVDIIHTDAGIFGFPDALGHVDFYPNGGRSFQPGCSPLRTEPGQLLIGCSHRRAWLFYAESVRRPKAFPASRCSPLKKHFFLCQPTTEAYMGFPVNTNLRGKFFLRTNERSPYGRSII